MSTHRYSGWPGAWCLDCGVPDPLEEALAHGCDLVTCIHCGHSDPTDEPCTDERENLAMPDIDTIDFFWPHETTYTSCGQHGSLECTEPGSRRFDPYYVGP